MSAFSGFLATSNSFSDLILLNSSANFPSTSSSISTEERPFTVYTSTFYYPLRDASDSPSYSILLSTFSATLSSDPSIPTSSSDSVNGTVVGSSAPGSTGDSNSQRVAIIVGVTLGCSLLVCLLVGLFCYHQRTRRRVGSMVSRNEILGPTNGYRQRGRRKKTPNESTRDTQEINGAKHFHATQDLNLRPAIDQTQDIACRHARGYTLDSIYSISSHISTSPSLLLPFENPTPSNLSSHPSWNEAGARNNRTASPALDTTSTHNGPGLSAPSTTSTERKALKQLSLPESWGRQVARMEMTLEEKRAQEKFLILPEPAYSAEGLYRIRGSRAHQMIDQSSHKEGLGD